METNLQITQTLDLENTYLKVAIKFHIYVLV